jgi:hypothetical protein
MYFERAILNEDKAPFVLWDNILQDATVSTTSQTEGGDGNNTLDNNTYDFWIPISLTAVITFTLPESRGASYLGIAAHNIHSKGCSIYLGYYNGTSWVNVASPTIEDDNSLIVAFPYTEAEQWRLRIEGSEAPSIGVVFLGTPLLFTTGILPGYTPIYMGEKIDLYNSTSLNGQFIGNSVERRGYESSFQLNILDRDFVEGQSFQSFRRHYNDGGTFFFASDPDGHREDVAYCRRQEGGEIRPTLPNDGIFYSVSMSLEGFIR